jgi:hypothetical protein
MMEFDLRNRTQFFQTADQGIQVFFAGWILQPKINMVDKVVFQFHLLQFRT